MGRRAVVAFGKAAGAGPVDEGDPEMANEPVRPTTEPVKPGPTASETSVIIGGPGSDTSTFSFKWGEREFKSQEELNTFLTNTDKEVKDLRAKVTPSVARTAITPTPKPEVPSAPKVPTTDEELALFFADPAKYKSALKAEIRQEMQLQRNAERSMETWWSDFWDENPALDKKKHSTFVTAIMGAHQQELGVLQMTEARTKLSELVSDAISTFGGIKKPREAQVRTTVEGAGASAPQQRHNQTEETDKPKTLSSAIKERRLARQKAANGSTQPRTAS